MDLYAGRGIGASVLCVVSGLSRERVASLVDTRTVCRADAVASALLVFSSFPVGSL
jgi:hypothetical protein